MLLNSILKIVIKYVVEWAIKEILALMLNDIFLQQYTENVVAMELEQ